MAVRKHGLQSQPTKCKTLYNDNEAHNGCKREREREREGIDRGYVGF